MELQGYCFNKLPPALNWPLEIRILIKMIANLREDKGEGVLIFNSIAVKSLSYAQAGLEKLWLLN